MALAQAETAVAAARRAAQPSKPMFALGFLTGQEMDWLPEAMRILRDELPNIEVTVSSQYFSDLANGLVRGKLDLAFLRPEANTPDLEFSFRNAHHPDHCVRAACGGLNPDPAIRVRGAHPHLLCSKAAQSWLYIATSSSRRRGAQSSAYLTRITSP